MQFKMKTKVVEVKKREGGGHIVVVEPASGGEQSEVIYFRVLGVSRR